MPYSLGLDFGTTSVSAIAIDHEGHLVKAISVPHQAQLATDSFQAEQYVPALFLVATQCLKEIQADLPEPAISLGTTTQMHGFLLLDQSRSPLTHFITWQDQRSAEKDATGQTACDRLQEFIEDQSELSPIFPGYALATLFAMHERKELPEGVTHISDLAHYTIQQLTGGETFIDPTLAASWGGFHLRNEQFASEAVKFMQSCKIQLPQICQTGEILGTITKHAAELWGLPQGMAVTSGIGDQQAAFIGSITHPEHELLINIGTGGQIAWESQRLTTESGVELRPWRQNRFLHVGAGQVGGAQYDLLVDQIIAWSRTLGGVTDRTAVYQLLAEQSEAARRDSTTPPLLCEPFFQGTRLAPQQRGMFSNISADNFSLGHLTNALLQSIVKQLYDSYAQSDSQLTELRRIVVSGNFFQHHPWLAEIIRQRSGVPVVKTCHQEQAAFGSALLAGEAVKLFRSPVEIDYETLTE